jgi:hypothetical protein
MRMVDQKPPRLVSGERETLLALLQYQRESFVRKVAGVDEANARKRFVDSGTTLLWLMKHMAQAEDLWIIRRFAGEPGVIVHEAVTADDTVDAAIETYRATWARVDAIVAKSSLETPCHDTGAESPVNLRWVLMHLLEETARHAGHADILRELIDRHTGR